MAGVKLKPCPFCGAKIQDEPLVVDKLDDCWAVTHYCPHPDLDLGVTVTVYGATKQEAVKRWNTRATTK